MSVTVLIIDDEAQIRRAVRHAVEILTDRVLEAGDGRQGIDLAASERPDLIILDLGLPDADGADVCHDIRGWSTAPIIVLSARHSDREKVRLLELGADDYVTKPFSTDELRARIRVQLRRPRAMPAEATQRFGELEVDLVKRAVHRGGRRVHLTPTEWELLRALVMHRGRTITHEQLFRMVWNQAAGDPQAYLRVHVANLRRKLERDTLRPVHILTESGVGYRFAGEHEVRRAAGKGHATVDAE